MPRFAAPLKFHLIFLQEIFLIEKAWKDQCSDFELIYLQFHSTVLVKKLIKINAKNY